MTARCSTKLVARWLAIAVVCGGAVNPGMAQTPPIFNVTNYGATANGTTVDTPAINNAIIAANTAGGGTVYFPAGNYLSVSIHLTNHVTLYLEAGATILAAATGFDDAESNPYVTCSGHSAFPDYGHAHFHDSLIWGENLHDVGFAGPGTVNGNANLLSGDPAAGSTQADKAITLKLCTNVVIAGITITRAGHFGILANGCQNFTMTNVTILNATLSNHRDGINLINSSHCYIGNCRIEGSDDAMCLKADWALGQKFTNTDIQIENCTIRSTQNNATQFGSETVGDFYRVRFANLNLIEAGKAGIGITSNDGSIVDGITYDNITMTNCACAIFLKLSNQDRYSADCDPHPVGRIRNVSINNVVARHSVSSSIVRTNTATLAGCLSNNAVIPMENIVLSNVNISTIGGNAATDITNVPPETQDWQPNTMGVRPSYGWYLRHVQNVSFYNCQTHFDIPDGRPAFIAYDVQGVKLDHFVADVNSTGGNASPYDLGFTNVTAYDIHNATGTNGATLRVFSTNSTATAVVAPPWFAPSSGAYTNAQSVTLASTTDGATIRYTTDGSTPAPSLGTVYSGAIGVTNDTILKAIAYAGGSSNSAVNTAIYNFGSVTPGVVLPPPLTLDFEAEWIPFTTNGAVAAVQSDVNSSNGKWIALQAAAPGPYIEFTLTNVPAGTYHLDLKYKGNTSNRGIITHQVDGAALGDSLDLYSSAQTYPVTSLGVFTFTSSGNHTVRQTVIGKNPAGTGADWTSADKFTLTQLSPALTGVTPPSGSTAGGAFVTITGSNFVNGLSVLFGASNAAAVNFSNTALVTAIAPAHAAGSVDVTVQNPSGQLATATNAFTFQTPPPPLDPGFTADPASGLAPLTVQFTDTTTGGPTNWDWNFGDSSPDGAAQNPSHTFTNAGSFTVTLAVIGNGASTNTSQTIIVTNPPPPLDPGFTAAPASGSAPLTVQFTDTTTGGPTNWDWNFGDSSPDGAAQNPSHTFTNAGSFTVTLAVIGNGASTNTSQTIIVTNPPPPLDPGFTADTASGLAPLTVQFTDTTTGGPTNWDWNFGDSSPDSAAQNPSHTFTNAGSFTVTLAVVGNGASTNTSQTIAVTNPSPPVIQSIVRLSDGSMQFDGSGTPAAQYTLQALSDVRTTNWVNLGSATAATNGILLFDDAGATNYPKRFYRLVAP